MIARIEKGKTAFNTDTLIGWLVPLGKILAIVPLKLVKKAKIMEQNLYK